MISVMVLHTSTLVTVGAAAYAVRADPELEHYNARGIYGHDLMSTDQMSRH